LRLLVLDGPRSLPPRAHPGGCAARLRDPPLPRPHSTTSPTTQTSIATQRGHTRRRLRRRDCWSASARGRQDGDARRRAIGSPRGSTPVRRFPDGIAASFRCAQRGRRKRTHGTSARARAGQREDSTPRACPVEQPTGARARPVQFRRESRRRRCIAAPLPVPAASPEAPELVCGLVSGFADGALECLGAAHRVSFRESQHDPGRRRCVLPLTGRRSP
jgi:hypothetical protein